ncbi:MAG: GNAT family N-acetyltransferase [Chloroflexota bacterium]
MSELVRFLGWDTEHFGVRIARVQDGQLTGDNVATVDEWCVENAIDCVYYLVPADDIASMTVAENNGFHLQDIRMVFNYRLIESYETPNQVGDYTIDQANADDLPALLVMIDGVYEKSRFYNDTRFDNADANRMYHIWLEKCLTGAMADVVFCARKEGIPQAFVTCRLDADTQIADIGLVGVAENARGQNLAGILLQHTFSFSQQNGMIHIEVATQGSNIAAQRLYQKAGFRTMRVHLWYHKWFT